MNLSNLRLSELDNSEHSKTSFIKAISELRFNAGIIFKRIGSKDKASFEKIISNLNKEILETKIVNGETKRLEANIEIHDFIFEILTHKDIQEKWLYNDDEAFSWISEKYNSKDKFQKIGLFEINKNDFLNRIISLAQFGSCYQSLNNSDIENQSICNEFVQKIVGNEDRIIASTQPWGEYNIGLFVCVFILKKDEILIFSYDDYD